MGAGDSVLKFAFSTTSLCCHVSTLPTPKPTVSSAPIAGPRPGLQDSDDFEAAYEVQEEPPQSSSSSRPKLVEVKSTKTGLWYSCARVPKSEAVCKDPELIKRHLDILSSLEHPHFCKVVECFETSTDYLLVTERGYTPALIEFLDKRDGSGWAGRGEKEASELVRQMLTALMHCHAHGIVHGRLEPAVLLLASPDGGGRPKGTASDPKPRGPPQVKIADMGLGFVLRKPLGRQEAIMDGMGKVVAHARSLATERRNSCIARGVPQPKVEDEVTREAEARRNAAAVLGLDLEQLDAPPKPKETRPKSPKPEGAKLEGADGQEGKEEEEQEEEEEDEKPLSKDVLAYTAPETIPVPDELINANPRQVVPLDEDDRKGGILERSRACPINAQYTDIWAVGLIAYHMLTGFAPFIKDCEDIESLFDTIRLKGARFGRSWERITQKGLDAVQSMLRLAPRLRPTASELLKCPWLKTERDQVPGLKIKSLFRNALLNLKEGQFKKLVMRVIVERLPRDHAHIEDATNTFISLDRDRDGLLNFDEFREGIERFPGLFRKLEDAEQLFEAVDRDSSGYLNAAEFAAATLPPSEGRDAKNLWRAFQAFDRNDDGVVTLEEVIEVATLLEGRLMSLPQLDELVESLRVEMSAVHVDKGTEEAEAEKPQGVGRKLLHVLQGQVLPRKVDFEEFVYLCETSTHRNRPLKAAKKEIFRFINHCADVDLYDKLDKNNKDKDKDDRPKNWLTWPVELEELARTARSVQQDHGGLTKGAQARSGRDRNKKGEKDDSKRKAADKGAGDAAAGGAAGGGDLGVIAERDEEEEED